MPSSSDAEAQHGMNLNICSSSPSSLPDSLSASGRRQLAPVSPSEVQRLLRYVIPSDNSCLFRSLCLLVRPDLTISDLRGIVSEQISLDPMTYPDVVLERPREEYMRWIQKEDSWGGFLELAILSEYLRVELKVADIQSRRVDTYGGDEQGASPEARCYLTYDGVHYDPVVALPEHAPSQADVRGFPTVEGSSSSSTQVPSGSSDDPFNFTGGSAERLSPPFRGRFQRTDDVSFEKFQQLVAHLSSRKKYTDTANMRIKCMDCGAGFTGEPDALQHIKASGHRHFKEVEPAS